MDKERLAHMNIWIEFLDDVIQGKYPDLEICQLHIINNYFSQPKIYNNVASKLKRMYNINMSKAPIWGGVYFVLSKGLNMVKIGYTKDINKRLITLQIGNPDQLELIAFFEGLTMEIERFFHNRFSKYRVQGEWFKYSQEIKDIVLPAKKILDGERSD